MCLNILVICSYSVGEQIGFLHQTGGIVRVNWSLYASEEALCQNTLFLSDGTVDSGCTRLIPLLAKRAVKRHISALRLTRLYCDRIQTGDRSTARPPCSHLNMSFGCFLRGLRFARLVSLFVVWVYVGWWWGAAHSSLTWQEQCCFWERVKCSKYAHWGWGGP